MENKKYVLVAVKYLMNLSSFQTEKRFEILNVFEEVDNIDAFVAGYSGVIEQLRDKVDEQGMMLTSFSVEIKEFDKGLTLEEIQMWVDENCSYEWGINWKGENTILNR